MPSQYASVVGQEPTWWWDRRADQILDEFHRQWTAHPYDDPWAVRTRAAKLVDGGLMRRSATERAVFYRSATQLAHFLKHPDEYASTARTGR